MFQTISIALKYHENKLNFCNSVFVHIAIINNNNILGIFGKYFFKFTKIIIENTHIIKVGVCIVNIIV